MDIDLLSKLIKEIVLEHDEISLPEIGTFVAELSPAVFSDKGFVINPPYRKLTFRQRVSSDALVAEAYAATAGLSLEQANADLVEFLRGLREILVIKKTVIFPGLGKMRATRENVFFFVPDADLDIYPDGYGLDPVSLRTHGGGETADVPATSSETSSRSDAGEIGPSVKESSGHRSEHSTANQALPAFFKVMFIVSGVVVVLAVALAILGRVAPEFVDKILYSVEDYKLLHG